MCINPSLTHTLDMASEVVPPSDGILSGSIFQDEWIKAVGFGFARNEELSENTTSKPALLYFRKSAKPRLGLGDEVRDARAGTWVHMPAGLKHAIKARTPTVMLLSLAELTDHFRTLGRGEG